MRIKKLNYQNFRGIIDLNLNLPDSQTIVLAGANGSAKTTILDGAAILLSRLVTRIVSSRRTGRLFSEKDIYNNKNETSNSISILWGETQVSWKISKARQRSSKQKTSDFGEAKKIAERVREQLYRNKDISVPVAVYYPVNRAVLDIPLRIRKNHEFHQETAYEQALGGASSDFRIFFEWFRQREDYENECRVDNPLFRDKQLDAVRQAVESLIPGFQNLRIRRKPKIRMTIEKVSKEFIVDQLSDGEKCILALAGDLARRLAIANPNLNNPLEGKGIVLIDEIELHLHSSWQRNIIPALEKTFQNCQFIISTHSPAVLGHVKQNSVFLLKPGKNGIQAYNLKTYGLDVNRIFEEVFDVPVRPQDLDDRIKELFRIIDKMDIATAKTKLSELRNELGNDEPELTKAAVLIRRKEILGR